MLETTHRTQLAIVKRYMDVACLICLPCFAWRGVSDFQDWRVYFNVIQGQCRRNVRFAQWPLRPFTNAKGLSSFTPLEQLSLARLQNGLETKPQVEG